MSRAIEDYICASEDRSHYNNERFSSYGCWGFYLTIPAYYSPWSYRDYSNSQLDGFILDKKVVGEIPEIPEEDS